MPPLPPTLIAPHRPGAALHARAAAWIIAATFTLPLLGAWIAGDDVRGKFRFPPPLEIPLGYPRWSWLAAGAVVVLLAAIGASWVNRPRMSAARTAGSSEPGRARSRLPGWAWLALGWTGVWWVLAWTRFESVAPIQRFTFFPLWLGFIVSVSGLTAQRTGTCLLRRSPGKWFGLFAASAGFWWTFEWLNRFVRNWHYLGVQDFGAFGYAAHATLCFSTVLPAVAAAAEWLESFAALQATWAAGPRWEWLGPRATGRIAIIAGAAALVFTGAAPQLFYPALWCAPLALGVGAGILGGRKGLWNDLAQGDWRRTATWALAACLCGFFWEMWNSHSAAKWIYTVPYVDRWHVFEMPLLGYAGYLAFGLECWLVVDLVASRVGESAPGGRPRVNP